MVLFQNLPLLMVAAFLVLTLVIGLYYSRKVTSLREYAVGKKQFTTATLVATVLATAFGGGGLVRDIECIHSLGLYWIIISIFDSLAIWIISLLAIRMGPFMQHLSMPETIGSVYGKHPRTIAAFACICSAVATIAGQIKAMSLAILVYIDSNNLRTITLLATLILIFYSTFGGIRSVTLTDVLQFISFTIIIPLLAWLMFRKIGKPIVEIIPLLQSQAKFQFSNLFHFDVKTIAMIALVLSNLMSNISPGEMQRVYMSSNPMQAKKVFLYAGLFSFLIMGSIMMIGLFVFVNEPELPSKKAWPYIMEYIHPIFKGLTSISLLAMAMSTADSYLNACAVIVSHDLMQNFQRVKHAFNIHPLWLARWTSIVVGLFAMVLAFYCDSLLEIMYLSLDLFIPIITAPFVLAIFGFRGSSHAALIGMVTGTLAILAWNKWILPVTDIDGAFPCMLANALAMLAVHYWLLQPVGAGWVPPDKTYQQRQQEKERIARRRKKAIKAIFTHKRAFLATLQPSSTKLLWISGYMLITSLIVLCYTSNVQCFHMIPYTIVVLVVSTLFTIYAVFIDFQRYPSWIVGSCWFISLVCCLPLEGIYSIWHMPNPIMLLVLSLTDFGIILWALPFYIGLVVASPLLFLYAICAFKAASIWPLDMVLVPLLVLGITLFSLMVYCKYFLTKRENSHLYFKAQQQLKESYQLKSLAYALDLSNIKSENQLEIEGSILEQAIQNVTQSISFSDEFTTFYKEDFQTIIHKFSEWATYLKQRAKSQNHALLQPTTIDLEDFIDDIEVSYEKEHGTLPSLWIEKVELSGAIPASIVGDREQLVALLVAAIAHIAKTNTVPHTLITLQLHTTHLQYKKSEPLEEGSYPSLMVFPAVALLLSHAQAGQNTIPEVEGIYGDDIEDHTKPHSNATLQTQLDLKKQKMERIVRAHYGYMALPNPDAILLVIPRDVTQIKEEMLAASLPRETGTREETTLTPQEQAASLTKLVDFHDWVCSTTMVEAPIISEILLLLRRCYGFKRHACGQLFYLRAVGIATWVVRWAGYHPKLIYAALLYDLVRYTRLPLSYIKANYNLGVLCFVENVLSIDSRSELEASLLAISNRFKEALKKEQLSVLYIKLAERLYDLEHADGYHHADTVKSMAKESLAVDVQLAERYIGLEIGATLAQTARKVLG